MKTLLPLFLMAILVLTSCSSEEDIQVDDNSEFLKSYTLSRDAEGNYSIDYKLNENTSLDVVKDEATNVNEIYLFSGKVAVEKSQSKALSLEDDQLALDIFENGEEVKSIAIEDGELEVGADFLQNYSITDLGNDTYEVNFTVKEGIVVEYEFNELDDTYEIHLKEGVGTATGNRFSKTYIKTADVLKMNFVNSIESQSDGKGSSARPTTTSTGPVSVFI